MNRKKRVKMIIRTLLEPFVQDPFPEVDLWAEKTQAFDKMQRARQDFRMRKRAYQESRRKFIRALEEKVSPDRVSELEQLVDLFYADSEINDYLHEHKGGLDGFFFEKLRQIAQEFVTLRDGRVSLRMWDRRGPGQQGPESLFRDLSGLFRVELWSELSRTITPDLVIAAYFCACGIDEQEQLAGLPDTIFLSDSLLSRTQQKGVAETHVHFNACMSYLSVWEAVTDLTALRILPAEKQSVLQKMQSEELKRSQPLLIAGCLRLMLAQYLESGCERDLAEYYEPDRSKLRRVLRPRMPGEPELGEEEKAEREELAMAAEQEAETIEWHILRHVLRQDSTTAAHIAEVIQRQRIDLVRRLRTVYDVADGPALDLLQRGPYRKYACLHTAPELLLLHASLLHVRDHPEHTQFTRTLLTYIRIKNCYFSDKLQASGRSGLTFFRRYFDKATRSLVMRRDVDHRQRRLLYRAAFRGLLHCLSLKKLEIKIAPHIVSDLQRQLPFVRPEEESKPDEQAIAEQLHSIFECFLEICGEQSTPDQIPTLGIVYHLVKEDMRYVPSDRCWIPDAPLGYITVIRTQGYRFVRALNQLLEEVEYLSEYVVGLDVASEEVYAEPWVYAPVFRRARNHTNTKPLQNGGMLRQNIGFTYHVGEDYHHILSGLRHIDEVLTYFSYKPGDRIGHGLALQVDIAEWLRNNEVVAIPVMEHLENMLWLWSCCGEGNQELSGILPQLENEIMAVAQRIYRNIRGLSPYVLWKAYTRKFEPLMDNFCQEMQRQYLHSTEGEIPCEPLPDSQRSFCALHQRLFRDADTQDGAYSQGGDGRDVIWDIDKLLLTHYCPIYLRHYQKQMLVTSPASYLNVFSTMQKYMRKKVERAGIYVEANPTSNMVIGDVSSLSEYRITSLNGRGLSDPEPSSILISINSDDPLIFSTNVENEMAIVYHTLLYRGFSYEEALDWINKTRKAGLNSSFIRKYKPFEQQKREIETIIRELERHFPVSPSKRLRASRS